LREQSRRELVTSERVLCIHLLAAVIKRKDRTYENNHGEKLRSTDMPLKREHLPNQELKERNNVTRL
jgi:hypothetical protein